MNKPLPTLIVILALIIAGYMIFAAGYLGGQDEAEENEGALYIGFTDETANMEAISEIQAEVDQVEVYSQSQGWVEVSSDDTSYDLLKLNEENKVEYYGKAFVEAGEYSKLRVVFDGIEVEKKDGSESTATLVAYTMDIDTQTRVKAQETSHITIDILADRSLHTTESGAYVFAPVLEVSTYENAEVAHSEADNSLTLTGGTEVSVARVGTDIDGSAKADFELPSDVQLEVSSLGIVELLNSGDADNNESEKNGDEESGAEAAASGSAVIDLGDDSSAEGSVEQELQGSF